MANVDVGLDPATGDLPAQPVLISGSALGFQRVENECRLIEGEWFLDLTRGLPLVEWLTTKGLDTVSVLARLEATLRGVPGVVTTFNSSAAFVGADLQIRMDIQFDDGAVETLAIETAPTAVAANGTPFLVFFRSGAIPGGPAVF